MQGGYRRRVEPLAHLVRVRARARVRVRVRLRLRVSLHEAIEQLVGAVVLASAQVAALSVCGLARGRVRVRVRVWVWVQVRIRVRVRVPVRSGCGSGCGFGCGFGCGLGSGFGCGLANRLVQEAEQRALLVLLRQLRSHRRCCALLPLLASAHQAQEGRHLPLRLLAPRGWGGCPCRPCFGGAGRRPLI